MKNLCLLLVLSLVAGSVQGHVLRQVTVAASSLPGLMTSTPCPMICPMIWFPVCGTDGKTYGNTCEMKVDACLTRKTITVAKQGSC